MDKNSQKAIFPAIFTVAEQQDLGWPYRIV